MQLAPDVTNVAQRRQCHAVLKVVFVPVRLWQLGEFPNERGGS